MLLRYLGYSNTSNRFHLQYTDCLTLLTVCRTSESEMSYFPYVVEMFPADAAISPLRCASPTMSRTPPPGNAKKTSATREPTTQLPLLRVKRIIKVDKDIQKCGNEAATLITRATVRLPQSPTTKFIRNFLSSTSLSRFPQPRQYTANN